MPVIVVGSSKGGSGKSTLCTNLAAIHAGKGFSTALLDTDPQRSASNWASQRGEQGITPEILSFEKRERSGQDVTRAALEMVKTYETVFVDAPGNNSPELRASMVAADILVYPIRPSNFDVWVFHDDMTNLVPQVRQINPGLRMMIVMNGMSTNPSQRQNQAARLRSFLSSFTGFHVSPYPVCFRESFSSASTEGKGVVEHAGKGDSHQRAVLEIQDTYREILACLNGQRSESEIHV